MTTWRDRLAAGLFVAVAVAAGWLGGLVLEWLYFGCGK
jgi:hypothetical protein